MPNNSIFSCPLQQYLSCLDRAQLKAVRHSLKEEDIDALAAAAHGFVSADLAAVCDEAAMAALRRIIASRQHPCADPPAPHPQAQGPHRPLSPQHPASSGAQVVAEDRQLGGPSMQPAAAQHAQQADAMPQKARHAQDHGVAGSIGEPSSLSMQPSDENSTYAEPGDVQSLASDKNCQDAWQVRHYISALAHGNDV